MRNPEMPSAETTAESIRKQAAGLHARLATVHDTLPAASAAALETYGLVLAHKVTESVYWEAIGAVPPIYNASGFWIGEPYSHDPDGCEVALQFWSKDDGCTVLYFCRYSRVRDATPPRGRLIAWG